MNWHDNPLREWRLLHRSLTWLGSAMLFAVLALLFSQGYVQYQHSILDPARKKLSATRAAADQAQSAWGAAQEVRQQYLEMARRRVFTPEDRLSWVEHLVAIQRANPGTQLRFRIEPQIVLGKAGGTALFASTLKVQYQARHEGVFSAIHQQTQGLFGWPVTEACFLGLPDGKDTALTSISIDCEYRLFTIGAAPVETVPKGGG